MILRITRYVSYQPWGSLLAEGHRRRWRTEQTVRAIWDQITPHWQRRSFSAAAGVLWTPVILDARGQVRAPDQQHASAVKPDERLAWLASRQPPLHPDKLGPDDPLRLDLTERLSERLRNGNTTLSILYDCRFLLRFSLALMPENIARSLLDLDFPGSVVVRPQTRWYLPEILWNSAGKMDVLLPADVVAGTLDHSAHRWIHIEWIRPLEAV